MEQGRHKGVSASGFEVICLILSARADKLSRRSDLWKYRLTGRPFQNRGNLVWRGATRPSKIVDIAAVLELRASP